MKQKELLYLIAGFVAGILISGFYISNTLGGINFRSMIGRGNLSLNAVNKTNVIDAHFIEQMIPHHEDAITMSEIALERASREEVKKLAQSIIKDQNREIEQMKNWYKEWFGRELPTGGNVMKIHGMMRNSGMHMGMMGDESDIERLKNVADFDRAFLEEMIPHHQMAVMMANMLKNGTSRPEMKRLAENIISSQSDEIEMMREWLKTWY